MLFHLKSQHLSTALSEDLIDINLYKELGHMIIEADEFTVFIVGWC